MLSRYKAVFFDAGGTLLHPFPSVGDIYSEVAGRYEFQCEAAQINDLFRHAWLKRDGLSELVSHSNEKIEKDWWRHLVQDIFSQLGGMKHFNSFFEELYEMFGHPDVWRLYPGTEKVLQAIKSQKKVLGIISNWDSRLLKLCEGFGLHEYFEFVIASAVFGCSKPSSKIFHEALKRANVQPHEAVHIGDSIEDDIHGALAAGLDAILINRHPERKDMHPEKLENLRIIHDLQELI